MATVYEHISQNKRRTVLLVLLFPLVFALLCGLTFFVVFLLAGNGEPCATWNGSVLSCAQVHAAGSLFLTVPFAWLAAVVWMVIAFFSGDKWLMSGAGAIAVTRQDQPEIYRLVENLCITRGLPVPRIYIMDDESLNAFATGRDPQHASVALTKGIVKKLERAELEGVIAHELAHVENRDIRLMLLTIAGISFFTFAGEWCLRMALSSNRSRSSKEGGSGALVWLVLGLVCLVYGYLIAPLIRLAVSRQREYQADATAALTTRNPRALARALAKISADPRVEALDRRESMAAMCIANPLAKAGLFSGLSGLFATHPPIEKRIAVLLDMDREVSGD